MVLENLQAASKASRILSTSTFVPSWAHMVTRLGRHRCCWDTWGHGPPPVNDKFLPRSFLALTFLLGTQPCLHLLPSL